MGTKSSTAKTKSKNSLTENIEILNANKEELAEAVRFIKNLEGKIHHQKILKTTNPGSNPPIHEDIATLKSQLDRRIPQKDIIQTAVDNLKPDIEKQLNEDLDIFFKKKSYKKTAELILMALKEGVFDMVHLGYIQTMFQQIPYSQSLSWAVLAGDQKKIRSLSTQVNDGGEEALKYAIMSNKDNIAKQLILAGVKITKSQDDDTMSLMYKHLTDPTLRIIAGALAADPEGKSDIIRALYEKKSLKVNGIFTISEQGGRDVIRALEHQVLRYLDPKVYAQTIGNIKSFQYFQNVTTALGFHYLEMKDSISLQSFYDIGLMNKDNQEIAKRNEALSLSDQFKRDESSSSDVRQDELEGVRKYKHNSRIKKALEKELYPLAEALILYFLINKDLEVKDIRIHATTLIEQGQEPYSESPIIAAIVGNNLDKLGRGSWRKEQNPDTLSALHYAAMAQNYSEVTECLVLGYINSAQDVSRSALEYMVDRLPRQDLSQIWPKNWSPVLQQISQTGIVGERKKYYRAFLLLNLTEEGGEFNIIKRLNSDDINSQRYFLTSINKPELQDALGARLLNMVMNSIENKKGEDISEVTTALVKHYLFQIENSQGQQKEDYKTFLELIIDSEFMSQQEKQTSLLKFMIGGDPDKKWLSDVFAAQSHRQEQKNEIKKILETDYYKLSRNITKKCLNDYVMKYNSVKEEVEKEINTLKVHRMGVKKDLDGGIKAGIIEQYKAMIALMTITNSSEEKEMFSTDNSYSLPKNQGQLIKICTLRALLKKEHLTTISKGLILEGITFYKRDSSCPFHNNSITDSEEYKLTEATLHSIFAKTLSDKETKPTLLSRMKGLIAFKQKSTPKTIGELDNSDGDFAYRAIREKTESSLLERLSTEKELREESAEEEEEECLPHREDKSGAQIKRISTDQYYTDDYINNLMRKSLPKNTTYISTVISLLENDVQIEIKTFANDTSKSQAVIIMNLGDNHFTGIHIIKEINSYSAVYFDPMVNEASEKNYPIPTYISEFIKKNLKTGIERSSSNIQTYEEGEEVNHHCGAFVTHFMTQMAEGNVRLSPNDKKIQVKIKPVSKEGADPELKWKDLEDLTKEKSNKMGQQIRDYHVNFLENKVKAGFDPSQIINLAPSQESTSVLTSASTSASTSAASSTLGQPGSHPKIQSALREENAQAQGTSMG
ncbi:MAG: hypothetical protein ACJAZX_001356 [Rickettsiales bacterium]|jgi:hypothetical protein